MSTLSLQKLPLAALQQVRQYIQSTIAVADTEQRFQAWAKLDDFEDLPEPESVDDLSSVFAFGSLAAESPQRGSRWAVSTVNPAAALAKLPGLNLKAGMRMVSYVFQGREEGVGIVWALPEAMSTTAALERVISGDVSRPPKPGGAFDHFMGAVEGDRSAASFMVATLLRRELEEFGATGKRVNWSQHQLIEAVPSQAKWQWKGQPPADLSIKVKGMPDGRAAIEFFTCRVTNPVSIVRHVELYPAESYIAESQNQTIALAQR
jgi:hypothetical protein